MHIENIILFFDNLQKLTELPLWAIFAIIFVCLFLSYFYSIRIPFAILSANKELIKQSKYIASLVEKTEGINHNEGYKYTWKR